MTATTDNNTLASKPCDIEYRVRRLEVLTEKAQAAISSIDPTAVSEGAVARGLELVEELGEVIRQIAGSKPTKRSYTKGGKEKPAKEPKAKKEPKARTKQPKSVAKKSAKAPEVTDHDPKLEAFSTTIAELWDGLQAGAVETDVAAE
jgi:hypothetical protein